MSQFTFGKFKFTPIKEVFHSNYYYVDWITKQPWFKNRFKEQYNECKQLLNERDKQKLNVIENDDDIIIYTDGACKRNGTPDARAGIGVHFSNRNTYKFDDISLALDVPKPTNNVAELQAILTAINIVKDKHNKIIIYTDSEYCILCITKWYPRWVKEDKLKDRKHLDLIQAVYELYKKYDIHFTHIRAHTGIKDEHSLGNEQADYLAKISLAEK
jgi:ribonuclease HI